MAVITSNLRRRLHEAVNFRLRTFAGGSCRKFTRPVSIVILLTDRCNARCVHCDIWKNRGQEDTADVQQWKDFLTELRSWLGPVHMVISGGEALLKPFTTDLVTYGASIGLFVEVLTHGYWKDQERIEKLARANPWRVTISLDGIGETHSNVRGRTDFWERTTRTITTLRDLRHREGLKYAIRLKTVIMAQNLDNVVQVVQFAVDNDAEVFYQPIEQNYNTPEDLKWFEQASTWPQNPDKAVAVVEQLMALRRQGLPIRNSTSELAAMIPYFRDPAAYQVAVQSHSAHERRQLCTALIMLEVRPNGDVVTCSRQPPIGNILQRSIRDIWRDRPRWWNDGCCLDG